MRSLNLLPILGASVLFLMMDAAWGQSSMRSDLAGNLQEVSAVVPATFVDIQPKRLVAKPGEAARFSALWSKRQGDTVQWAKAGVIIPGQTGDSLILNSITAADDADYTVTATTASGPLTSTTARLYIDTDGDGLGDAWEQAQFGSLVRLGSEDTDSDGVTNAEEFEDGTNANSNTSRYYRLSVEAVHGRVLASPASTTGRYPTGTVVTLTTQPQAGWQFTSWTGGGTSLLPSLTVTMTSHVSLVANFTQSVAIPTATGSPSLTWNTGGDLPWQGESQQGVPEGTNLVQQGVITHSQESWIQTTVTGPGTVSWWWKVSSDAGTTSRAGDILRCEIDGVAVHNIKGEIPWQPVARTLSSGAHTVRWAYAKDSTVNSGSDTAWLDKVVMSTTSPAPLANGIDLPGTLNALASGSEIWALQTTTKHDGTDALQSPAILDDEETWVETTVVGPGSLSFWWKVSSEAITNDGTNDRDRMEFMVDGTLVQQIYGEVDWTRVELYLNGTEHKLRWRYVKDFTATAGADAGWLDEVSFTPSPTLPAAVDQAVLTLTTGGAQGWGAETTSTAVHDGVDAGRAGSIVSGQESWMETTITGPGTLTFWWNVSSRVGYNYLDFSVDGAPVEMIEGTPGWTQVVQNLPAGSHTLRWTYHKSNDAQISGVLDTGWVDEMTWTPATATLADAVDNTDLSLTTTGNSLWTRQTTTIRDGSDAAQAGPLTASGQSVQLNTYLTGPGLLSFWWKSDCASTATTSQGLRFVFDGVLLNRISGNQNWVQVTRVIPPGTFPLSWEFVRPSSASGTNTAWLDSISFTPGAATPLATALDGAGLNWTTGGHGEWKGFNSSQSQDGVDMAGTPALVSDQNSWVETTVTGPGTLSYQISSSSELNNDFLRYYVNGTEVCFISGEQAWVPVTSHFGPGTHRLRWQYEKDGGTSTGTDAAFLDQVFFTSVASPSLMDAVDTTTLSIHSGPIPWTRQTTVSHGGGDAAQSGTTPDNGTSWMQTHITGPGTLTYWWKVSSQASGDYLRFYQDGSQVTSINGTVDWVQVSQPVAAGKHAYIWQYTKNGSITAGSDAGWVDEIVFTPATNATLAGGIDIPGTSPLATTSTSGAGAWTSQTSTSHDGTDALQSPVLADSQFANFETTLDGPGMLSFWYKVSSEANGDYFRFYLDGTTSTYNLVTASGEVPWTKFEVPVSQGAHRLLWEYRKDAGAVSGLDAAWVDEVTVTPSISLAVATDNSFTFTTGGSLWEGQVTSTLSRDGVDRASSGTVSAGQDSWMETTISGAGIFSFDWRCSCYPNEDYFRLFVDGVEVTQLTGEQTWQTVTRNLPTGSHTVRWTFAKGAYFSSSYANRGYVDRVAFAATTTPPLQNALDLPATSLLTTMGHQPWQADTTVTHDGSDSGRSGAIGHSELSWFEMAITGPGTISFWWKVSCESNGDYLRFYVDGVEPGGALTGEQDWQLRTDIIAPGAHTLRWRYAKNSSVVSGSDAGWVDQVVFTPSVTLATALDTTGISWTTGGSAVWNGYVDGATDWAASGKIGSGQQSFVETNLTGPGTLQFQMTASSNSSDYLGYSLDGEDMVRMSGNNTAWRPVLQTLPAGLHTVRWTYAKASSGSYSDLGRLDAVTYAPAAAPPLADGVDAPALPFFSYGDGIWTRDTTISQDASDSVKTGPITHNQSSYFGTYVDGPGTLSFWWKVSSQNFGDFLRFYIDNTERVTAISGERDWVKVNVFLDKGRHFPLWVYEMNASTTAGANAGWVDGITFTAAPGPSIADGVDNASLTWVTGPASLPWQGVNSTVAQDGVDAALLDVPGPGVTSWLETTVAGPKTLRFWWRTDTGRQLKFFLDGVQQGTTLSNNTAWAQVPLTIASGSHTVRWEGSETNSTPLAGAAGAWLDGVTLQGTPFSDWQTANSLSGNDANPLADVDLDGVLNLLEFAFNLNPKSSNIPTSPSGSEGRLPVAKTTGSGASRRLVVEFLRRQNSGLTYQARFSDDLVIWEDGTATPSVLDLGGGWELVTWPDHNTLGSKQSRQASVKVTMP